MAAAYLGSVWTLFALFYTILYLFLCTTCLGFIFFEHEILRVRAKSPWVSQGVKSSVGELLIRMVVGSNPKFGHLFFSISR